MAGTVIHVGIIEGVRSKAMQLVRAWSRPRPKVRAGVPGGGMGDRVTKVGKGAVPIRGKEKQNPERSCGTQACPTFSRVS